MWGRVLAVLSILCVAALVVFVYWDPRRRHAQAQAQAQAQADVHAQAQAQAQADVPAKGRIACKLDDAPDAGRRLEAELGIVARTFVDSTHGGSPKWSLLLEIGRTYKRGEYPHLAPDDEAAWQVLRTAASCPDGIVAGEAQLLLMERCCWKAL